MKKAQNTRNVVTVSCCKYVFSLSIKDVIKLNFRYLEFKFETLNQKSIS